MKMKHNDAICTYFYLSVVEFYLHVTNARIAEADVL